MAASSAHAWVAASQPLRSCLRLHAPGPHECGRPAMQKERTSGSSKRPGRTNIISASQPPASLNLCAAQLVPYAWSLSSQPGPPTKKPQKVKAKEVLAVANVAPRDGDTSVASDRAFLNSVYPPK